MRLALLLAAPFPLHQGSQVYVADQARALAAAGAEPTVVCYGAGSGAPAPELRVVRTPAALTPQTLRSSAHPAKALADLTLARALLAEHRRQRFDAVLAHNSEATGLALAIRRRLGIPVVYVVHTLLRHELSAYGPRVLRGALDTLGARIERHLSRNADAILVLSQAAHDDLAPLARGPVRLLPPGLTPSEPPCQAESERVCRAHGVEPGCFVLYTGNVDTYQDLDVLDAAAARAPELTVLAATHDPGDAHFRALRVARIGDRAEMRALLHACAVAVLPRQRPGGFPIKLLNYMEASRAIVAYEDVGEGLEHGRSAWLLGADAGPDSWADALGTLLRDPDRRAVLGAGARMQLERTHAWQALARGTLELVTEVVSP